VSTNPTTKAARSKRRQLREDAAQRGARIDPDAIYDRDNGLCYLCKLPVARELATLDHVIPLAKGGKHAESNLRTAHRACNSEKGTDTGEKPRRPGLRRTRRLAAVVRRAS